MKAKVQACFYSSYKLQGWRKLGISLMQMTRHTHVHLEIEYGNNKYIILTVDGYSPRIIKLGLNKKFLGIDPYYSYSFGLVNLDPEWQDFVSSYKPTKHWDLIKYQILRWFNLHHSKRIPPTCATFVSDFMFLHNISVPMFFSPKQLWRYWHDGYNVWR